MQRRALAVILLAVSVGLTGCAAESSGSAKPTPSATVEAEESTPTAAPPSDTPVDLAGSAVATASSEAPGNPAANATDGDPATEWSSGDGVGSSLTLEWDAVQELGSITLSDRANSDDHVEAGTLEFSDGTTALVPALPDDGAAILIEFAPRSVTSVRFIVDAVGPNTTDVGLTEIGAASPQTIASVLGTERFFSDGDGVALIRPNAVTSVDDVDSIRLIRVDLEIVALAGTVYPSQSWFTMLGADGARYDPVDDPADELADPIGDGALEEGDVLTGTVHFEVPSDGSGFLIGYAPDPDAEPLATWSLNAA